MLNQTILLNENLHLITHNYYRYTKALHNKPLVLNSLFCFVALVFYMNTTVAQSDSSAKEAQKAKRFVTYLNTELVTGINFQEIHYGDYKGTRRLAEFGIARSIHKLGLHGPISSGVVASEEIALNEKSVFGTKVGGYMHYLFDFGLFVIYYTDFQKGNLKLRPEFGVGFGGLRIVAGYNIPTIDNKAFNALRKSDGQITVHWMWPVKKHILPEGTNIFKQVFKTKK